MPNPFERQINDLGVHSIPPMRENDPRVRLAEEDALQAWIGASLAIASRSPRWKRCNITVDPVINRRITLDLNYYSQIYPSGDLTINTSAIAPALTSAGATIRRDDTLYLVVFGAIAGAAQDPDLGQVSFQYLDRPSGQLTPTTKENAKRDRVYWALISSQNPLTAATFLQALPLETETRLTGDRYLAVTSTAETGFSIGSLQIFARDPKLAIANYSILSAFVEVVEICNVRRLQNHANRGYTWGNGGEEPLTDTYAIARSVAIADPRRSTDDWIYRRFIDLCSGVPGIGSTYERAVQNLTNGPAAGNPGNSGESSGSPNGSTALANDQRVSFTNQAILQRLACQILLAGNDGGGNALLATTLNTNAPLGTRFSENRADHKIYRADGAEISANGTFQNLGGTGSLIWVADSNAGIVPGQQAYFVPAVRYPSGSGFPIPFQACEAAWRDGAAIAPENIRNGFDNDIDAYTAPTVGDFLVVLGRERAALHYIYRRVTVTADGAGVVAIPGSERGVFAFIEGVSGRIDAPVRAGLTPGATYNALVYYPPRSTETWQFRFQYPAYQGTGATEASFLNGATVASAPRLFAHTQGGGGSVFRQGDRQFRYSAIAMHLPKAPAGGIPEYRLYLPCQLPGEPYPGPLTFRELPAIAGSDLALPTPGQVLSLAASGSIPIRGIQSTVQVNGQPLGFRAPTLNNSSEYQAVLVFLVEKGGQYRLAIATKNTSGGENVALSPAQGTAIDTFRI